MNPILSGGGFFPTYAWSHSIALGSRHIGSLPGELGSSGTQVQSLLPLRSTFMLPFRSSRRSSQFETRLAAPQSWHSLFSLRRFLAPSNRRLGPPRPAERKRE